MRTYNHRDKRDLAELRQDLETLSTLHRAVTVLYAIRVGLFRAPLPFGMMYKLVSLIYGPAQGAARAAIGMSERYPRAVHNVWNELMRHMTEGRNADDPTSAGAWNRRELNIFLIMVRKLGWTPPTEGRTPEP